ncbi:MAG: guanine deaminase [Pseudomonadota bacterium]
MRYAMADVMNEGLSHILIGQTIEFVADPFLVDAADAIRWRPKGAILIRDGQIDAVDEADTLIAANPTVPRIDHGMHILSAGFVDCHNHYPQTRMIASWGSRLIDWLNTYTFPEEQRFGDASYAAAVAGDYLDLLIANGTTAAAAYCTIHPESVDAVFQAAAGRNMAMTAGKVMMDRNAPAGLTDTAATGYEQSKILIDRWHNQGRAAYAVSPRFAPTSSEAQLAAAGALWREHPDCAMQTHLSEQNEEVAWVRDLFPGDRDYLAVYERHGLTGPGAIMGHAIYLGGDEGARMALDGTGVAHCPTSNLFIGSGLCDVFGLRAAGVAVGLATDTGGGSSFSMLTTMKAAYEVAQLQGRALHPAQLWWLATAGSAAVMRRGAEIGSLAPGAAADIIALDPAATPVLAQRTAEAKDIAELLFSLIVLGDDRAVAQTWIAGQPQKVLP